MKYLFRDWDKLSIRIGNSAKVFLLFDFDGTLSPIASSPSEARLPATVKVLLKEFRKNSKFKLAIISGRSLKDLKKKVGVRGITYVGNHGLQIEGRKTKFLGQRFNAFIKMIEGILRKEFKHIKGVKTENKGVTLSLHYRRVEERYKPLIKRKFHRILRPFVFAEKVKISSGKEVLEVRPKVDWDKGSAVTWLLKKGRGKLLPMYFGDDITDMDAFRAIKFKGISIFVGNPGKNIEADYFLKGPGEVEKFMEKLLVL